MKAELRNEINEVVNNYELGLLNEISSFRMICEILVKGNVQIGVQFNNLYYQLESYLCSIATEVLNGRTPDAEEVHKANEIKETLNGIIDLIYE